MKQKLVLLKKISGDLNQYQLDMSNFGKTSCFYKCEQLHTELHAPKTNQPPYSMLPWFTITYMDLKKRLHFDLSW